MRDARSRLLALLRERAVLQGDFVLSSGRRSSRYLDARLVTLSAEGSPLVGEVFLDLLAGTGVEAAAGPTVAADPIVAAIAVTSGLRGKPIDGIIIRKTAKEHGTGRRLEGPFRPGMQIAVVDDTLTTGGSLLDAARAVIDEGGAVSGLYALIDRLEGGRETIEAAGFSFQSIYTLTEVMPRVYR